MPQETLRGFFTLQAGLIISHPCRVNPTTLNAPPIAFQQATWAAGDYAVIGTTLQIVGERLCEAVDLWAFSPPPPVMACVAGGAPMDRSRATDYVGALLDRAKERASAERLTIDFQEADAEALPDRWATVCSLITTAKLNGVEPFAYLEDVLARMSQRASNEAPRRPFALELATYNRP